MQFRVAGYVELPDAALQPVTTRPATRTPPRPPEYPTPRKHRPAAGARGQGGSRGMP